MVNTYKGRVLFALVTLLSAVATATPHAWGDGPLQESLQPALIQVTPDRVFAPLGFDDNDNAQIVLDGELPDTCHKLGPTVFKVDPVKQKIYIAQQAYYYPGAWCAQVRVPYVQAVNLGILRAGQYEVNVQLADGALKSLSSLPVAISPSASPDDFLYAPVTDAYLERTPGVLRGTQPQYTLYLNGTFNNSCMRFGSVQTNVRPNNVIEVLPIVEMSDEEGCTQMLSPFKVSVSLNDVPKGRYLIHVRSLNGQAVNRIVDL